MKKSTGIKVLITVSLIVVAIIVGFRVVTQALIDDSNSVHIDATKIEDSTIIIGTHLIYIGSLNDTIYEAAQKSAEESSQYNMYYKSELSSGLWFDITDASSLEDITTSGVPVDNSVINQLNMTHHTKSDGITYDLRTGKSVSVCDIKSPYDLEGLDELNPLKVQFDNISANEDKTETDERNLALIKDFYSLDFTDSITEEYDNNLKALQEYYEILQRDDGEQYMSDIVLSVMDKIDATRRMQIFENMQIEALDNLIKAVSRNKTYDSKDILNSVTNNEKKEESAEDDSKEPEDTEDEDESDDEESGGDKIDGFTVDNNLLSALSEAVGNIEESYNTYSNKMLDEGITVLSRTEYNEIMLLVAAAKSKDYATCDIQVYKISHINQINNGMIKNRDKEREYLEDTLIPSAEREFQYVVGSGAGSDYTSLPSTAASATKQSVLKKQKAEADRVRTELQFLIKAKIDRLETDKAETYIKSLIDNSSYYKNSIKNDAFAEFANSCVESYVMWLNEQLAAVKGTMSDGTIDGLMSKKSQLQEQKLEALDNNDLAKAKRIDAEIAAIDKTIADEEERLNNIINSPTATEAEKAAAAASLGSSTASGAINNLEKEILASLKDGNLDGIDSQISSIGDLASVSPQSALNSLKNIYDELTAQKLMETADSSAIDGLLDVTETVTSDNIGIYTNDLSENDFSKIIASYLGVDGNGGSSGNGSSGDGSGGNGSGGNGSGGNGSGGNGSGGNGSGGNGTGGSDEVKLSELFGAGSTVLTDKEQAVALVALGMFYDETKSETAGKILDKYSNALMNAGNPYIFNKYAQDGLNQYAPADKVALLSGYRYIFNDSQKKVILQKGSDYYVFNAFSNIVERPSGKTDEMEIPCGYQNTIYICESFLTKFGIEIQSLGSGDQAIVLSDKDTENAAELFDYFVEMGGR